MGIKFCAAMVVFAVSLSSAASAATVILSGDTNVGNPIDGSSFASVNADNSTFFLDALGSGTSALIVNNRFAAPSSLTAADAIDTLYGAQAGVTSTLSTTNTVTAGLLSGIDLFVGILLDTIDASEISAVSSFLGSGGTLFLLGDSNFQATFNANINTLLAGIGSTMRLGTRTISPGFQTASNIASDPLMAGITSLDYAFKNTVIGGATLASLPNGTPFIAYEGSTVAPIPVPGGLLLQPTALAGFALMRRRLHS